ncbi:hypothetical protein A3850_010730 [Lewinella sp. 4G2]|nr:hypothetical protein A3850_010730 [Lewinella sp. 4G2]
MNEQPSVEQLLRQKLLRIRKDRVESNDLPTDLKEEIFATLEQRDQVAEVTDLFVTDCAPTPPALLERIEPAAESDNTDD